MIKRVKAKMNEDLRERVSNWNSCRTMKYNYGKLIEHGLDSFKQEDFDVDEYIEEHSITEMGYCNPQIQFEGKTHYRVKRFCKRNSVKRPIAYAMLLIKGLYSC